MSGQKIAPTASFNAPTVTDWLLMLFLAVVWGCSFLFIKRALVVYTPIQVAMWRMVLASLAYVPIAIYFWKKINWSKWKPMLAFAFLGSAFPSILFAFGQTNVSSSLAGVLNSLAPLLTFLIGLSFFKMAYSKAKLFGVLIGLAGAILLVLQSSKSSPNGSFIFAFLCILGTCCYATMQTLSENTYEANTPQR